MVSVSSSIAGVLVAGDNPLVSVIIPCWNQARFLPECIASLRAQTYRNWEAIIVNDGSPDDAQVVSLRLATEDGRVRVISKENGGLSSARNSGLGEVVGRFVQFLDADDLVLPRKLETQVARFLADAELDISYCDYRRGAESNPYLPANVGKNSAEMRLRRPVLDFAGRWETEFSIPIHAALFRAELFGGGAIRFDETLPNHEDWDIWMELCSREVKFEYLPEEFAIYRQAAGGLTSSRARMWYGFSRAIKKQKRRWQNDREVSYLLSGMWSLAKYRYGRTPASWLNASLASGSWLRRYLPWPAQRVLRALSNAPGIAIPQDWRKETATSATWSAAR